MLPFSFAATAAGIAAMFSPVALAGKAAGVIQVTVTALNDRQTGREIDRLETKITWEVNRVREEIRKHDLSNDPRFLRSVEAAVQLSLQTIQDDKIDLFARILARAAAHQNTGDLDTAPVIMRAVSAMTPDELRILQTLQRKLDHTRQALDSHELAGSLIPGMAEKNVEIFLHGLVQLGLVKYLREKSIENKTFGVWNVTVLGKRVVDLTNDVSST